MKNYQLNGGGSHGYFAMTLTPNPLTPVMGDQFILPKYKFTIKNEGVDISNIVVSFYMIEADLVSHAELGNYKGKMQNVHNYDIASLPKNSVSQCDFIIESKFLKPCEYYLIVLISHFEEVSPTVMHGATIEKWYLEEKLKIACTKDVITFYGAITTISTFTFTLAYNGCSWLITHLT